MKSTATIKNIEKVVKVEEKTITLEMTERQAEILYHFMGASFTSELIKKIGKKMKLDKNMIICGPDAIDFHINDALAPHFDQYHRDYKPRI